MRAVGIIPARYGSTRFPGKALADIRGKPMIQHVYERAGKVSLLDGLFVATDDRRILDVVHGFGGKAVLTRGDHPSGTDRVAEACRELELADEDIVVNIQGDEPLVESVMIDLLIEALERAESCPMATLGYASRDVDEYLNPNVVKVVVDARGRALYFSRSPIPHRRDDDGEALSFLKHLGFYAYRHAFLQAFTKLPPGRLEQMEKLEQLRALEYGYSIQLALSPVETLGIDTPEDLARLLARSGC